jgi:hypothetical protein
MTSGFRDDFRQSIASGYKARTGFSQHGGSQVTGGYGHGMAVDVPQEIAGYIAQRRNRFGLVQRMPGADPFHIQPERSDRFRDLAATSRAAMQEAQRRREALDRSEASRFSVEGKGSLDVRVHAPEGTK